MERFLQRARSVVRAIDERLSFDGTAAAAAPSPARTSATSLPRTASAASSAPATPARSAAATPRQSSQQATPTTTTATTPTTPTAAAAAAATPTTNASSERAPLEGDQWLDASFYDAPDCPWPVPTDVQTQLPAELWMYVLSFLTVHDALLVMMVCRFWRYVLVRQRVSVDVSSAFVTSVMTRQLMPDGLGLTVQVSYLRRLFLFFPRVQRVVANGAVLGRREIDAAARALFEAKTRRDARETHAVSKLIHTGDAGGPRPEWLSARIASRSLVPVSTLILRRCYFVQDWGANGLPSLQCLTVLTAMADTKLCLDVSDARGASSEQILGMILLHFCAMGSSLRLAVDGLPLTLPHLLGLWRHCKTYRMHDVNVSAVNTPALSTALSFVSPDLANTWRNLFDLTAAGNVEQVEHGISAMQQQLAVLRDAPPTSSRADNEFALHLVNEAGLAGLLSTACTRQTDHLTSTLQLLQVAEGVRFSDATRGGVLVELLQRFGASRRT